MGRFKFLAVAAGIALMCSGCLGRAINEGIGSVRGPKGVAVVVDPIEVTMTDVSNYVIEPFADQTPTRVPPALNEMLATQFAKHLASKGLPWSYQGGRTVTIRGTYVYLELSTTATAQVFGPFEEVIAKVELVEDGKVIGRATCIGRSTTTVNQGLDNKADGLAKGIVDWIDKAYPKRR
jgi:hypothetical protein